MTEKIERLPPSQVRVSAAAASDRKRARDEMSKQFSSWLGVPPAKRPRVPSKIPQLPTKPLPPPPSPAKRPKPSKPQLPTKPLPPPAPSPTKPPRAPKPSKPQLPTKPLPPPPAPSPAKLPRSPKLSKPQLPTNPLPPPHRIHLEDDLEEGEFRQDLGLVQQQQQQLEFQESGKAQDIEFRVHQIEVEADRIRADLKAVSKDIALVDKKIRHLAPSSSLHLQRKKLRYEKSRLLNIKLRLETWLESCLWCQHCRTQTEKTAQTVHFNETWDMAGELRALGITPYFVHAYPT